MPKSRPKTGDRRKTNQPLKIDRMPASVHEAIEQLYKVVGRTWVQIEEQSALGYNPDWQKKGGGFVHWEELPTPTLELFPEMRLPKSNLQRWFDLRIAQVRESTMQRAEHARYWRSRSRARRSRETRTLCSMRRGISSSGS